MLPFGSCFPLSQCWGSPDFPSTRLTGELSRIRRSTQSHNCKLLPSVVHGIWVPTAGLNLPPTSCGENQLLNQTFSDVKKPKLSNLGELWLNFFIYSSSNQTTSCHPFSMIFLHVPFIISAHNCSTKGCYWKLPCGPDSDPSSTFPSSVFPTSLSIQTSAVLPGCLFQIQFGPLILVLVPLAKISPTNNFNINCSSLSVANVPTRCPGEKGYHTPGTTSSTRCFAPQPPVQVTV